MLSVILTLITLSLVPQQAIAKDETPAPYTVADAYEVYSTILPSEWPMRVSHAKMLVILNVTKSYKMCLTPEVDWQEIVGSAISDYVELNKKTWLLQERFSLEVPYQTATADVLKLIQEQGGWEVFYQQYPHSAGWIELSAVGFNSDKTVAVVYMGHHCGGLCGGGGFHDLQKKDGVWVPLQWKGASCSWAS